MRERFARATLTSSDSVSARRSSMVFTRVSVPSLRIAYLLENIADNVAQNELALA